MMDAVQELPKVSSYTLPMGGHWSLTQFASLSLLTFAGTVIAAHFAFFFIRLTTYDLVVTTLAIIWAGAGLGVYLSNRLLGRCRHLLVFEFAMLPTAMLGFLLGFALVASVDVGGLIRSQVAVSDTLLATIEWFGIAPTEPGSLRPRKVAKFILITIAEGIGIAATPVLLVHLYRSSHFCEQCGVGYKEASIYKEHTHDPIALLHALRARNGRFMTQYQDPNASNEPTRLTITASYCPGCKDAVVEAKVYRKHGRDWDDILVYSDFWEGTKTADLLAELNVRVPAVDTSSRGDSRIGAKAALPLETDSVLSESPTGMSESGPEPPDADTVNQQAPEVGELAGKGLEVVGRVVGVDVEDVPGLFLRIVVFFFSLIPLVGYRVIGKSLIGLFGKKQVLSYEFETPDGTRVESKVLSPVKDAEHLVGYKVGVRFDPQNPRDCQVVSLRSPMDTRNPF
jgi:hypothetical protein